MLHPEVRLRYLRLAARRFLYSRFAPGTAIVCCEAVLFAVFTAAVQRPRIIYSGYFKALAGTVLLFSAAAAAAMLLSLSISVVKRRWHRLLWQITALAGSAVSAVILGAAFTLLTLMLPSEDHFADELTIPGDIRYSVIEPPPPLLDFQLQDTNDPGQRMLGHALRIPGSSTLNTSMPHLYKLRQDRERLFRSLAASPAWRVGKVKKSWYAERRFHAHGRWHSRPNGYAANIFGQQKDKEYFQFRLALNLDGIPSLGRSHQYIDTSSETVDVRQNGSDFTSSVLIPCGDIQLQIFEQTRFSDRRLTPAALKLLESEAAMIPDDGRISGISGRKPELKLRQSSYGGGSYDAFILCNPGEPGYIYLKAFEITCNTPLSFGSLKKATTERPDIPAIPEKCFLPTPPLPFSRGTGANLMPPVWRYGLYRTAANRNANCLRKTLK